MLKKFLNLTAGKKVLIVVGALFFSWVGVAALNSSAPPPPAENTAKTAIETKEVTETEVMPFGEETKDDTALASGSSKVVQAGVNGEKTIVYEVTYENGQEKSKKVKAETVTKAPVNKVTATGTYVAPPPPAPAQCDPNYTPCVPNVSYDLDCPDIGFSVRVIGTDVHRFDREGDGHGCESY